MFDEAIASLKEINLAANAFKEEVPAGSDLKFRMPRNRSHQSVLATAQAFHDDAVPLEAKFIEYGLDKNFLADLQTLIDNIKTAQSSADSSEEQKAAATGGLIDAARRGMANSRKLNAIVRIKYADNPQKLASWTVASHLEKAPKKKAATNPTPPTP